MFNVLFLSYVNAVEGIAAISLYHHFKTIKTQ